MALVVFMRGVNVGGHKTFRPSELVKKLDPLKVVNHGAAGTFIVHGKIGAKALRKEILRLLPFEAELMICPAEELLDLVRSEPFAAEPPGEEVKRFVSVLANPPRKPPRLPIERPGKADWEVRVVVVSGRFALSLWRRGRRNSLYPNEVVEKEFGVAATTRAWTTITSLCLAVSTPNARPGGG